MNALPADAIRTRTCSKCGLPKTLDQYRPDPRYRDGLVRWCRLCCREYNTARARATSERRNALRRERRRVNPERTKALRRRYYQMYKDKETEYMRRWREKNRSYVNAWIRAWNRSRKAGDKKQLAVWLAQFTDRKKCTGCLRIRSHVDFDTDRRTRDGMTALCLSCLPPLRSPRGGLYSLDKGWDGGSSGDERSMAEWVGDARAVDPERAALASELSAWITDALSPAEQSLITVYIDAGFEIDVAASEIGVTNEEAERMLSCIQARAIATFDDHEKDRN